MTPYVLFDQVGKTYDTEGVKVDALHDVSFEIGEGEVCVIVGQSGAGKTTLLNILGGMDTLTAGKVFLGGEEVSAYNRRQLTRYRREDVGFVFQFYNLIPNLTALENVEMATELAKAPFSAEQVLADVGLSERMYNFPA
ncbi:MAG: ATP-binding cassette domain-containing protein, partial [Eubacteriales bacterium]